MKTRHFEEVVVYIFSIFYDSCASYILQPQRPSTSMLKLSFAAE